MSYLKHRIMSRSKIYGIVLALSTFFLHAAFSQNSVDKTVQTIAVEWHDAEPKGTIEVYNGRLSNIRIVDGKGKIHGNSFEFKSKGSSRLELSLADVKNQVGSDATRITIRTATHPFTFFLRDVTSQYPISIPLFQVVVTAAQDSRNVDQIESFIKAQGLKSKVQQLSELPEESFDSAAIHTRNQSCPTWLGISRDIRIFELNDNRTHPASEMNLIKPRNSSTTIKLPELDNKPTEYAYLVGRGQGVSVNVTRRLDEGVLPILHSTHLDEDIDYQSTMFVSLEKSALNNQAAIGTDYLVADQYSGGHMLTKQQQELVKPRVEEEINKSETTVFYYRCEAINRSSVPRYAWFKTIRPGAGWWIKNAYSFDKSTGFSNYSSDRVFGISKLNGLPLHDEEISVLIKPGEKAIFEFYVPHSPITKARAEQLSHQFFDLRLAECKTFWKEKLANAAQISVPETRINEMIQAGLLHLNLVTYGKDPMGTLAPAIGVYTPIGTESAPIIQFYNSMGLTDVAKRSLTFFLDKQHDDGMIQNFGGYMVETGAALWSMGEYFRYTKDKQWVQKVEPQLLKASEFLLQWRAQNKKIELKGKGYGMIAGKVADPEDPFHQYMLNAYAYLGLSRVAEMLKEVDATQSNRLEQEALAWKNDIRISLENSISNSPVVPLGDGSWSPTVPPWTEAIGPRALHIIPENYVSHGTVTAPDVLLGPLYLVFCEVLTPEDPISKMMLNYHSELFYQRNAAFSQPYYSRHNWIQLKLGMIKPFLKTYYNTFSALADRDTYSFWEHLYQVSSHKTHEEGWFLMETRWMLYLEEGQTLNLLPGVPRQWLEDGKKISLNKVQCYFGPLSLDVTSHVNKGSIEANITCNSASKPQDVRIRIPHPAGKKAIKVTGGTYESTTESVLIQGFQGTATVKLEY
jgi:hypothetical protein